ncbi:MAG: ATP synthase subunit b [uncultured bacterium]|nr:MAG: ATP synthase subunit b [uncultured bacterium]
MELINALGLNVKILLAQLINFGVLVFVIYKFAYGPIMKVLDERQAKIEKGIDDAMEAGKKLVEIEEKEKSVLSEARKEAQEIIKKAQDVAEGSKAQIIEETKQEAVKIMQNTQKKIEQEREKIMGEVRGEISGLILAVTEKIIDEKMDGEKDKKLVENMISDIK